MKNTIFDLERLMVLMPGNVYWLDRENVYQGCNNNQALACGLSSIQDIVGKRNKDMPAIDPSVATILDQNNLRVMDTGGSAVFQEPFLLKDGTWATALSHKIALRDDKGCIVGLLGISLDVTDSKKQQALLEKTLEQKDLPLEQILSHMPGHVYWKNKEGVYLGCNDRQAKTLGFNFGREIIGKTDFDLPWGKEAGRLCRENDLNIMSTGITEKFEEQALIEDKEVFYLSMKTPLKNRQNETEGILGISIDISKQKEFEKKLIEAKEMAERANKAKSEFLYNMRHDLRTPFSGILGVAEFLEHEETDLTKKEKLRYVTQSAAVLLEHLNQIFEMVNIENGEFLLVSKQFNLYDLMNDTMTMMMPSAKNKDLSLTLKLSEDLPEYVIGDPMRTQRILINLIANSLKFTDKGSVSLEVALLKKEDGKAIVKFTVEDTGIGIPEDKIDFVFEQFNRLKPSYNSIYPGKGLGLSIVKQFLEDMGGEVHLTSELNKGSTFKVLVPFKETLLNCAPEEV